jgi:hypothetical protein
MHKAIILLVGLVAIVLLPLQADAAGVKLTKDQVATVCGKGMTSHGGSSGCEKKCGLNGEHTCEYSCYKGKECEGNCTTCGVEARTVLFPNWYANRVVRKQLRSH